MQRKSDQHRPRVLHLLAENPLNPGGGLGVTIRYLVPELADDVDQLVLCMDQETQAGGLFMLDRSGGAPTHAGLVEHGRALLCLAPNMNEHSVTVGLYQNMIVYELLTQALLREPVRGFDPDIIHLHDTYLFPIARHAMALWPHAKLVTSCHLSFSMHFRPEDDPGHRLFWRYEHEQEAIAYGKSDAMITCSKVYKRSLKEAFIIDCPLHAIHNGIDLDQFNNVEVDRRFKRDGRLLMGFVGRLVPTKGIADVIAAARIFSGIDFLVIASDSPTAEVKTQLELELGRADEELDNLFWEPRIPFDETWKFMLSCDAGLMPSRHEPFGIVALEWMALGVPLIGYRTGGLVEFCTAKNAIMVDPGNLSDALFFFIRDEARIAAGRETAASTTWSRAASQTLEVYDATL